MFARRISAPLNRPASFTSRPYLTYYSTMANPTPTKYQLSFVVPPENLEACKAAIFAAGAGSYPGQGNYTECCWTITKGGLGQFRPGNGANPHIGTVGDLEYVEESRVETLCVGKDVARAAVAALKKAHPYEEVAYSVVKLEDF
ncbi:hypothetical protein Sste5346_009213 [Sporothrix stenoceras]|uniref:ATP phosphoribosyltransferase n=1 Tax=Sporothrix stenoceras TaxID=5173 RepID=A0ABR3YKY3_9PEZI